MAARDRWIARCQEYLPLGTQIRHVFRCHNYIGGTTLVGLLYDLCRGDSFVVAVTANDVFVLRASYWLPWRLTGLEAVLPRDQCFHLEEGLFFELDITLMNRKYRLNSADRNEVVAANSELKPGLKPKMPSADVAVPAPPLNVFRRRWSDDEY
jgi:hypothetical protein